MIVCQCPPRDCAELVRRFLGGDQGAGDELARRFTPLVRGIVRHVLGVSRREQYEDATQAVFLHLFRRLPRWGQTGPFCHWLAVVATHRAVDCRLPPEPVVPLPPDPIAAPSVSGDVIRCMRERVARWPAERQKLFEMLLEEVPREEMAARLGVSVRTVGYRLEAIRADLADCLDDR
jgi:DNA-directed RNA polymerase specialized sigma24 family protein